MAITIQDIADKAGVSRGTVDRALNNRGRVAEDVAARILKIADELGYDYKTRKRKTANSTIKVGVITQLAKASFMIDINRGINQAKKQLRYRKVEVLVEELDTVDEAQQLAAIDRLVAEDIKGLTIMPVDSEAVREKINWLVNEKKIPVVTFNSDIVGTNRLCYVGMDNEKSGRTAAGLMSVLTKNSGKILVITGHFNNDVNNARVNGFVEALKKNYPELELVGVHCSFDRTEEVEHIIETSMMNITGITGILVVSNGEAGIEKAFETLHLEKKPGVIIYDQTPKNEKILEKGFAEFLIDQDAFRQGSESLFTLADYLLKNKVPSREYIFTDIIIKNKYNLV